MRLKDMKNPEKCKHEKIAFEKTKIVNLPSAFKHIKRDDLIRFEHLEEGEIQRVIRCLKCGCTLELEKGFY